MSITALPTPPQRSDPTNFPARADAFMSALPAFGTEANALQVDVNNQQLAAANSASAAATSAGNAAASESNAAASAAAAASGSSAAAWVSGTTYSVGTVVYSPSNFRSYRRITAGAGTTDPSLDTTNWLQVSYSPSQAIYVRDEKASNTYGGTSISGTQKRTLNTVVYNTIVGASLASDMLTLPSGTYEIFATAPALSANGHQLSWYNSTDGSTVIVGSSEYAVPGTSVHTRSHVVGRFTINSSKTFQLNHYIQSASTTAGLGQRVDSGLNEVYAEVKVTKLY